MHSLAMDRPPVSAIDTPATELVRLLRKLTPTQRRVLRALPEHGGQYWRAIEQLGHSTATGHRWMRKPHFARARELLEQRSLDEIGVTHHRILAETAAIAFSDPRKLFHQDGRLKAPHELDDDTAAAIASIEVEQSGKLKQGEEGAIEFVTRLSKIKRQDKQKALELLGRYRRMWGDDQVKPQEREGPGLTVIVQTPAGQVGVQAEGGAHGKVVVKLPEPE